MSQRIIALHSLFDCPVHKSAMLKMRKAELEECRKFIKDNDHLDEFAFSAKLNMWYVDTKVKPKNVNTMWAMVCAANTKAFRKETI